MRPRMAMMADRMRSASMVLEHDRSGATSIEYALIATFISIVVVGWATFVGQSISGFFMSVANGF
jgi:pilus assembly protein Flp/PilA